MIDPVVLFFIFGIVAGLIRDDLRLPPAAYDVLSLVLLLAIGLPHLPLRHDLGTRLPHQLLPNRLAKQNKNPRQKLSHLRLYRCCVHPHLHLRHLSHKLPRCYDVQIL